MTPMKRFEAMISESDGSLPDLTPRAGLDLLLRFIQDEGGGRIRTEWGDVSRHADPWIPGFTFRYEPTKRYLEWFSLLFRFDSNESIGWGGRPEPACCAGAEDAAAIRDAAERWEPFRALADAPPAGVTLERPCQQWIWPYDCWGVRDPDWPIVSMTPEEWDRSDDTATMSRWFIEFGPGEHDERVRLIDLYLVACCRRLWPILPADGDLRKGIETAERWFNGAATLEEVEVAAWHAEGEGMFIDNESNSGDEHVVRWTEAVAQLPRVEIAAIVGSSSPDDVPCPFDLLRRVARFVYCVGFGSTHWAWTDGYPEFLIPSLLREVVGDPFSRES